jgi:hypothetical protein
MCGQYFPSKCLKPHTRLHDAVRRHSKILPQREILNLILILFFGMVIFILKHLKLSELTPVVTTPTYIREGSGSNIVWDADYSY